MPVFQLQNKLSPIEKRMECEGKIMNAKDKTLLDRWISRADNNEIIILIGAGFTRNALMCGSKMSAASKIPLWNDLILNIQRKMDLELFDPLLSFDIYRRCYNEANYENLLRSSLPDDSLTPGELHKYLKKIPKVKAIITTNNIDTLLDKTFDSVNRIVKDTDVASHYSNTNNINIIYLHGHRNEPKSWIFSRTDYEDINKKYPLKTTLCRVLLASYPSLFLGFGHCDQDLHSIMRYVNSAVTKYTPPMISLSLHETNPHLAEYWDKIGLSIVQIAEKGKTINAADELLSVLKYINSERNNNLIKKNNISRGFRIEKSYMDHLVELKLECKERSGMIILCDYHESRDQAVIYRLPPNSGIVSISPYTAKIIDGSATHKLIQKMEKGFVPAGSWGLMPSHRNWLKKGIHMQKKYVAKKIKILIAGIAGLPHFVDTLSLLYKYIPKTVQMEITVLDYCIGPLSKIERFINGKLDYSGRKDYKIFKEVHCEIGARKTVVKTVNMDILIDSLVKNTFDIILSHHLVTDFGVKDVYKIEKYGENIFEALKVNGILISAQNFKADDTQILSFQDMMQKKGLLVVDSTNDFDIYDLEKNFKTDGTVMYVDKETLLTIHKKEKAIL